jgi:hypothetical protein
MVSSLVAGSSASGGATDAGDPLGPAKAVAFSKMCFSTCDPWARTPRAPPPAGASVLGKGAVGKYSATTRAPDAVTSRIWESGRAATWLRLAWPSRRTPREEPEELLAGERCPGWASGSSSSRRATLSQVSTRRRSWV